MPEQPSYKHWRLDTDIDDVVWLYIDRDGEKQNSLSREVLEELEGIVGQLEKSPPKGLVLQSGKPGNFIVGADVRQFDDANDPQEAAEEIRRAHALYNRVEALSFPKVVAIEGYCLGGGLELALCFDYRIARNDDKTRLGFPEVKLGIYPGFGGSARATQLLGGKSGLEIMLTGRMLRPGAARGMGLVDKLVGVHESLRWAARKAVLKGAKSSYPNTTAKLTNLPPARKALASVMRKETAKKANPKHYPAPFELIDAWEAHGDDPQRMKGEEVERVSRLITTDTSRNLRRVFRLMELLKAYGKKTDFHARHLHVIGAGTMGGDIAAWGVYKGLEVTLQDREMKYIQPALERAEKLFKKRLRKPHKVKAAMQRLQADVDGKGVARADVVIEAIFENRDAKRELFQKLEGDLQEHAILATNTSAIPLEELSSALERPERLIGLHFFNPVAKMPLVEVVWDDTADQASIEKGASFCSQIDRYPLPTRSIPGFLVNRVLAPYMLNAMRVYREGVPKEAIDKAVEQFGMPMGPVELADTVGLDIGMDVIQRLGGDDAQAEAEFLKRYVEADKLGKKTGEGFYRWEDDKPVKDKEKTEGHDLEALAERLMAPYFAECLSAMEDQVVDSEDALDAGMIFGTGFAPFRGGPLHYLKQHPEQVPEAHRPAQDSAAEDSNDE